MLQARKRLKRVPQHSAGMIRVGALALVFSLTVLPTPSHAATTISPPIRSVIAQTITSSPMRQPRARRRRVAGVVAELADFTNNPTPSDGYVVTLIHQDFPARAWHDAEAVAWCESKFRPTDMEIGRASCRERV